jgi:hypothetical protein
MSDSRSDADRQVLYRASPARRNPCPRVRDDCSDVHLGPSTAYAAPIGPCPTVSWSRGRTYPYRNARHTHWLGNRQLVGIFALISGPRWDILTEKHPQEAPNANTEANIGIAPPGHSSPEPSSL